MDDVVKTPRPDLALGFYESDFLSDLASAISLPNSTVENVTEHLEYLKRGKDEQGKAKLVTKGHLSKMKVVKSCNGVVLDEVESFIAAVDNVLRWATGNFHQSVVDRLAILVKE